jgi:hypothetical protein
MNLNKWPSAVVVINEETSPCTDLPCSKAALALPLSSSACPSQTLAHHLSNDNIKPSAIEGEEWLLVQAVYKITIDKEDSLPALDEVLPTELSASLTHS